MAGLLEELKDIEECVNLPSEALDFKTFTIDTEPKRIGCGILCYGPTRTLSYSLPCLEPCWEQSRSVPPEAEPSKLQANRQRFLHKGKLHRQRA